MTVSLLMITLPALAASEASVQQLLASAQTYLQVFSDASTFLQQVTSCKPLTKSINNPIDAGWPPITYTILGRAGANCRVRAVTDVALDHANPKRITRITQVCSLQPQTIALGKAQLKKLIAGKAKLSKQNPLVATLKKDCVSQRTIITRE